jgi:hypothetical protein
MITTSKEINLSQLTDELNGIGLVANFTDPANKIIGVADGFDLSDGDLKKAVANHTAVETQSLSVTDKLALVGLSVDDLKAALGL